MSPSSLLPTYLEADRVISTFSFDPDLESCPHNLHRGEAIGPPESISRMARASTRRSGVPHEGYADPIINDGCGFHSDMPISELTEARHSSHRGK